MAGGVWLLLGLFEGGRGGEVGGEVGEVRLHEQTAVHVAVVVQRLVAAQAETHAVGISLRTHLAAPASLLGFLLVFRVGCPGFGGAGVGGGGTGGPAGLLSGIHLIMAFLVVWFKSAAGHF